MQGENYAGNHTIDIDSTELHLLYGYVSARVTRLTFLGVQRYLIRSQTVGAFKG